MTGIEKYKQLVIPAPYDAQKCNPQICAECANERPVCCQTLPCILFPEDIKDLSYQGIMDLIGTGLISIDWFDGGESREYLGDDYLELQPEGRYFFLRIRGKDRHVIDPALPMTQCGIWDKDSGCPLEFGYRPKEARELIPTPKDMECKSGYSKKDAAKAWLPYGDLLDKAYGYYHDRGDYESIDPLSMFFKTIESLGQLAELAYEKEDGPG